MAAIVAADILFKFSVVSGAAGNAATSTYLTSLGKYVSTSQWANAATLFPDITGAQNAASQVDYVGLFLHNSNTANDYQNAVVYISAETAGGASLALASDNIAVSALGATAAQEAQIANSTTAPTGVSAFSSPTTAATGVALGTITANQVKGFWVRRSAANTAALSGDGATLAASGDTGSL